MDSTVVVTLLGGLGFFLLGIHHLTEGMKGLAGDSLRRALQRLVAGRLSAVASGALYHAWRLVDSLRIAAGRQA
jgi:phosphate:Na+ symporter